MYYDIHCANCLHWDERFDPLFTRNGYCKKYKKPVISLSTCTEWIYYNYPKRQNVHDISAEKVQEGEDGDECGWFEPIEDHTQLKYNPIRPIKYPSTERSFLRDESCQSNIIGKDNGKILGIFCYDAKT